MVDENALTIYTDGASFNSPREGGIGVRFVFIDGSGDEQFQDVQFAGYKGATNNQMELLACIQGLKEAMRLNLDAGFSKIIIISDSRYIVENIYSVKYVWPKTKWHRRGGSPVLNTELWKDLIKCIRKAKKRVEFRWVKGHSKDVHNRAVDKLAKKSAQVPYNKPLSLVHVRKKFSPLTVEVGSVELHGQRLSIRIISAERLPVQKVWKYKYEVISKGSKYKDNIDIIYSDLTLSAGHCYYVVVNDDCVNPRIKKVIRELKHI